MSLKFTKFSLVGILNSILGYFLYLFLLQFFPYRISFTIAYFAGVGFSYVANSSLVFRLKISIVGYLRFLGIYILLWLTNYSFLSVLVTFLGTDARIAPIIGALLSYPISYILLKGKETASND